ncbi:flagellar assembly protein FliH [Bacillus sp. SD088]|uniref:flagellar assembly protein FliH n=1 Tax=Bacillus sp. SD088 TaxID=2782012 RepID=UPI001A959014|nr:flagellar assembly protein FliH [Bacillus sp. SD088]MBO0995443.1 flagellar assembly protein FliH [Bacillus sp. SD088]
MSRLFKSHLDTDQNETPKMIQIKSIKLDQPNQTSSIDRQYLDHEEQRIISEAKLTAETLIHQAKEQANLLLADIKQQKSQWELEKKDLVQKAYEEGFQIGANEGRQQGLDEYTLKIEQAKQITDQSKVEYEQYVHSSESVILDLAIAVAERIMHSTFEVEPERFIPLVQTALKEVRNSKEIQIHVHPSQYELLISEKQELETIFPKDVDCFIYPDVDLEEYACQIESEHGRVDANISSQLVELKEKLLEILIGEES